MHHECHFCGILIFAESIEHIKKGFGHSIFTLIMSKVRIFFGICILYVVGTFLGAMTGVLVG